MSDADGSDWPPISTRDGICVRMPKRQTIKFVADDTTELTEGQDMDNDLIQVERDKIAALEARVRKTREKVTRLEADLERVKSQSVNARREATISKLSAKLEAAPDDTIVTWTIRFAASQRKYQYVALKTQRGWYMTGANTNQMAPMISSLLARMIMRPDTTFAPDIAPVVTVLTEARDL